MPSVQVCVCSKIAIKDCVYISYLPYHEGLDLVMNTSSPTLTKPGRSRPRLIPKNGSLIPS